MLKLNSFRRGVGDGLEPRYGGTYGKVSGKPLVIGIQRPVKPPQLFARFAAFVAMLQSSGDGRTNAASTLVGRVGNEVS